MTIYDETTRTDRKAQTYNHYDRRHVEEVYAGFNLNINERSSLLMMNAPQQLRRDFFTQISNRWFPNSTDHLVVEDGSNTNYKKKKNQNGYSSSRRTVTLSSHEEESDDGEDGDGDDDANDENGENDNNKRQRPPFVDHGDDDEADETELDQGANNQGGGGGGRWKGKILQHITPQQEQLKNGATSTIGGAAREGRYYRPKRPRSFSRRLFLFLTEPNTSVGSAIFFFVLIVTICLSNIIMICQTMDVFQFTPDDCQICGGTQSYTFDDDGTVVVEDHQCVCQPQPFKYLQKILHILMYFFAVEWTLRVLSYTAARSHKKSLWKRTVSWFQYLTSVPTLIDALAIWPHFFTSLPKGFFSLRLIRVLRVFSLMRLGQYNDMFVSLTNVLVKSFEYLKLMVIVLIFGGALFGSLMYWVEKGQWKYWEETGQYQFIRIAVDGVNEEISPFDSIPTSFWWFLVTATTVG
jgi:Ion transport protein